MVGSISFQCLGTYRSISNVIATKFCFVNVGPRTSLLSGVQYLYTLYVYQSETLEQKEVRFSRGTIHVKRVLLINFKGNANN